MVVQATPLSPVVENPEGYKKTTEPRSVDSEREMFSGQPNNSSFEKKLHFEFEGSDSQNNLRYSFLSDESDSAAIDVSLASEEMRRFPILHPINFLKKIYGE